MRKDRLYLYTFLSITLIFVLTAGISVNFFVKYSAEQFLKSHLESNKREAQEVAELVGFQLQKNIDKKAIAEQLQKTIEKSQAQNGFICMFDWSGKQICHPNRNVLGQEISSNQSFASSIK